MEKFQSLKTFVLNCTKSQTRNLCMNEPTQRQYFKFMMSQKKLAKITLLLNFIEIILTKFFETIKLKLIIGQEKLKTRP